MGSPHTHQSAGPECRRIVLKIFSRVPCRVASVMLGGLFVLSGVMKLFAPYRFAEQVSDYGIIPDPLVVPFAFLLPVLEILAGAGLAFNVRWSLEMITSLLVLFITALAMALGRNLGIDCGCFSPEELAEKTGAAPALVRDIFLLAAAVYLFLCRRFNPSNKTRIIKN